MSKSRVVYRKCCRTVFAAVLLEYDDKQTRKEHLEYAKKGHEVKEMEKGTWQFEACKCPKHELPESLRPKPKENAAGIPSKTLFEV